MPDVSGFAKGAASLLTGGLANSLIGEEFDPKNVKLPDVYNMSPEMLKQASQYNPSVLQKFGNLLTGGIYGAVSGMDEKQDIANQAKQLIMEKEIQRRLMERMNQQNLNPVQEPPVM